MMPVALITGGSRGIGAATALLAAHTGRVAIGVTGGPGVGKSTLATQLVDLLFTDLCNDVLATPWP